MEEAREAFETFLDMPVQVHDFPALLETAWQWGTALNTPRLYDMYYLALAEQLDCDLWVVDKKLVNLIGARSSHVKWIGNA